MIDTKTLISITGTTTAGKSTLAKTLLLLEDSFPIPNSTSRPPRDDDDKQLICCYPPNTYESLTFITKHGGYGIQKSDILRFLNGKHLFGVNINTAVDIKTMSKLYEKGMLLGNISRFNIVITITDSFTSELDAIHDNLKNFFSGAELNERMSLHSSLAREYFFSEDYLNQYIDLNMYKEGNSVFQWCKVITSLLGFKDMPKSLENDIQAIMSGINQKRCINS